MVPPPNNTSPAPEKQARPETDSGEPVGFDEAALYTVVREAVEDALLDVVGTLLLVGIAFVLVMAGGQAVVSSDSAAGTVLGLVVAVFSIYIAATSLEVVTPVRGGSERRIGARSASTVKSPPTVRPRDDR